MKNMAMRINLIVLSILACLLLVLGINSEKIHLLSQVEEEPSFTTYIEFTDAESENGTVNFDDSEIENSLLAVFQHEMIDGSGIWVCSGLVFSDDLNRASRLAVTTRTGLVRLFALANANNFEAIRVMLNSYQLDDKKLPTLDRLEKTLFEMKQMNSTERQIRMKDTTLLLTDGGEGQSISIELNCLNKR